jgi:hypothetical protein
VTANGHAGFSRFGFGVPRPLSEGAKLLGRPAQHSRSRRSLGTYCLDPFESSPTSDVSLSRPGRRSSFPRLPTAFACLVSSTRRPPTIYMLQPCPLGHPKPSRTLIPLADPKATKLPNALTPVIVSIPRSAIPRARAPVPPSPRCSGPALPEVALSRAPPVLSYDPVSPHSRASTFVSARSPRALRSQPHSPPFFVANPGGCGVLGHLSPHGGPVAPLARLTFRTSVPQGCGAAATLVVIDQCQQPTILFSQERLAKRWEPSVSVHSASRIPTRRSGSRYTPFSSQPR